MKKITKCKPGQMKEKYFLINYHGSTEISISEYELKDKQRLIDDLISSCPRDYKIIIGRELAIGLITQ